MKKIILNILIFSTLICAQSNNENSVIDTSDVYVRISDSFGWGGGSRRSFSYTLLNDGLYVYQYYNDDKKTSDVTKRVSQYEIDIIGSIINESEIDYLPRRLFSRTVMGPSSTLSIMYRTRKSNKLEKVTYDSGSTEKTEDMIIFSKIYSKLLAEFRAIK